MMRETTGRLKRQGVRCGDIGPRQAKHEQTRMQNRSGGRRAASKPALLRSLLPVFLLMMVGRVAGAQRNPAIQYQLDRDVIAIPFEYREHEILLQGEAAGRRGLTFLFDSGASSPVLDAGLGLNGRQPSNAIMSEAEGETKATALQIDGISVGMTGSAASASSIRVLLTDLSQISKVLGRHIDGILGASFISGFVVEIDYAKHLLRFHRKADYDLSSSRPDNTRSFLFELLPSDPFHATSTALIKGLLNPEYDYDFLLDTGYGGYASIGHRAAEQSGMIREDTPRVRETAYGVTRSYKSEKIRARFLALGRLRLENKIVSVDYRTQNTINQTGIIGNLFLQNYHVTLDLSRHKLLLERDTATEEPDEATRPALGIALRADGDAIWVDRVLPFSPARIAGLRPGDQIIAINGQSVRGIRVEQALAMLVSAQVETHVKLQRGVDPNLGTEGQTYTRNLVPLSPLDWKAE